MLAALGGCPKATVPTPAAAVPGPVTALPAANPELAAFFEEAFDERLAGDPVLRTYLGIGDDHGAWGDLSDAGRAARVARAEAQLATLRARFDPTALSPADALSFRLFEADVAHRQVEGRWPLHDYPVNQMRGEHTWFASLLMGVQPLRTAADIDDWLARLRGIPEQLAVLRTRLEAREAAGVMPPAFAFPPAIAAGRNLITGAPFDGEGTSPLLATFTEKVATIEGIDEATREARAADVAGVLADEVGPAYEQLLAFLEDQAARATDDDGAWKLPDGDRYYTDMLAMHTSTDRTPEQVHALGLAETERIHGEMRAIQAQLGVQGTLSDFFAHVQAHPDLTLPDSAEGREAYLALARDHLAGIDARLDEVIATRPQAALEVRAVEPWREAASGKAFYQRGTVDGSRPGVFYANLSDMSQVPTYQLQALVYHEGVLGHHLQLSIAQELRDIPTFRRHMRVTAWSEGWGLYSEWLPHEMGLYTDPYSDFGRLAMELWRAGRLVVDTGIHHQKWTRDEAIDWLVANTPNSRSDAVKSVERYIIWPGQATAYKVGMLELQRMRAEAEAELGDAFDLAGFHEVVLRNGPLPLDVLDEQVQAWIEAERAEAR